MGGEVSLGGSPLGDPRESQHEMVKLILSHAAINKQGFYQFKGRFVLKICDWRRYLYPTDWGKKDAVKPKTFIKLGMGITKDLIRGK